MAIARNKMIKPPFAKRNKNGEKICVWCGGELSGRRRKWCSQECVDEYLARRSQAGMVSYVKIRDNGICAECGIDSSTLKIPGRRKSWDAHHVIPLFEGGRHEPDNVITLCYHCHKKAHSKQK